ncbi:MAG: hypothetical protein P1U68_16130 [Verrucomicrobiales bacterium]|nr:hypothetical protein [Verrucomicrobiales bacterium]
MNFPLLLSGLCAATALLSGLSPALSAAGEPTLQVSFTREGVTFAGKIPSEEYGQTLAESVKSVRPDLSILNLGLKVDPEVEGPDLGDLKSLLAELGISTHEGHFSIDEESLTIGGMTDSRITSTALKIRLDPLLGDRNFINRICIVNKDDLPKLSVHLSSGETSGPLLNFDLIPTAAEAYEPPGLSISNLFPMMLTLSDLSRLKEKPSITDKNAPEAPMQAVPLLQVRNIGGSTSKPTPMLRAMPAPPQPTYIPLSPVLFTRDSFLLQVNQESNVDAIVAQLSEPPLAGHPILVQPVKSASRSGAFGDYLIEKRAEATKTMLLERGISASLISVETIEDKTSTDRGEVRLVVKIPPPPQQIESKEEETPEEALSSGTVSAAPVE